MNKHIVTFYLLLLSACAFAQHKLDPETQLKPGTDNQVLQTIGGVATWVDTTGWDTGGGGGGVLCDSTYVTQDNDTTWLIRSTFDCSTDTILKLVNNRVKFLDTAYVSVAGTGIVFEDNYNNPVEIDLCDIMTNCGAGLRDTVTGGYDALKAIPGTDLSDAFYLEDWTYTYNSSSYTSLGGVFRKVASCTKDGGICIQLDDGTYVKRDISTGTYRPEFWEVGGDNYSASLTEIINERDRLEACHRVAPEGAEVYYMPSKVYSGIDIQIAYGSQQVKGNKATLKRVDRILSTLTAGVSASDKILPVASVSGFRAGQRVTVLDGITYNDHDNSDLVIDSIVGLNIHITPGLTNAWSLGDEVMVVVDLMTYAGDQHNTSSIENLTIDGNFSQYHSKSESWLLNATLDNSSQGNILFASCRFVNIPNENIVAGGVDLVYCQFDSLGGGITHINNEYFDLEDRHVFISNCSGSNLNLNLEANSGHGEGVITFSNKVTNVVVDKCHFYDGGESIIGPLESYSGNWKITNSIFKRFKSITTGTMSVADSLAGNISIENNFFEDCGNADFYAFSPSTNKISEGYARVDIKITKNTFTNTKLSFNQVAYLDISGNTLRFDSTTAGYKPFEIYPQSNNRLDGAITVLSADNVRIFDNTIETHYHSDTIDTAIKFVFNYHEDERVIEAGPDTTNFQYMQNVLIGDNNIYGFLNGIDFRYENNWFQSELVNWKISDNIVSCTEDTTLTTGVGILVPPGAWATGNIITNNNPQANYWGLIVAGIANSGYGDITAYLGGKANNNDIRGSGNSIKIGSYLGINCEYNIQCYDNRYSSLLTDSSTNSDVSNNTNIDSSLLPSLTSRRYPATKYFGKNSNLY